MKAIIRTKPGKNFASMKVCEIQEERLNSGQLKIKMISSRINPVDMDLMKGFPSLKYKIPQIGGIDGAGVVIEIGAGVTKFEVGDEVIFYRLFSDIGTWAETITINAEDCAIVPSQIKISDAGGIALPLLTAFESIKKLNTQVGEKILIHGVGGGVGFQALQIAKRMGLHVIGTGSQNDFMELKKVGLDEFIDYKSQDFYKILKAESIDYVFDTLGGDILKKSIALHPKKIVSIKFIDTQQMVKSGVQLPNFLKFVMKLMMRKFVKMANRNGVELLGQVSGANGKLMQEAIDFVNPNFEFRQTKYLSLFDIEKQGMKKADVGKVILFNS